MVTLKRLRRIYDTEADFEIPPRPVTKHLPKHLMSKQSPLLRQKQPSLPAAAFFQPTMEQKEKQHAFAFCHSLQQADTAEPTDHLYLTGTSTGVNPHCEGDFTSSSCFLL